MSSLCGVGVASGGALLPAAFWAKGRKKEEFLEELIRRWDTRYTQETRKVFRMSKQTIEGRYRYVISKIAQEVPEEFVQAMKHLPADLRAKILKALTEEPNGQPTRPKRSKRKRDDDR